MTDEEWEKRRMRAAMTAFQTGRPVLADSEGELRYADGNCEPLGDEIGVPKTPLPDATMKTVAKLTWRERLRRWFGGGAP
jgi:hypothetical protein